MIEQRKNIVFVDEAVFSKGQLRARYWSRAGAKGLVVDKEKLGFKAIAVVAAINLTGHVVALLAKEKSIVTGDFLEFLGKLNKRMKGAETLVFLDNLSLHHTNIIAQKAKALKQVLVFNAPYSSHLNPIERLWALAKRQFTKNCVTDADFKS